MGNQGGEQFELLVVEITEELGQTEKAIGMQKNKTMWHPYLIKVNVRL